MLDEADVIYGASPIRRRRRKKGEITAVRDAIYSTLEAQHPATIRGLFYSLVSQGVIDKTEAEYKSTVCRLSAEMRRAGTLPYSWITDNTRLQRKPESWGSMEEALEETARYYRRSLWRDADVYVEVWTEKDTISGVLYDVTSIWDVPLMVARGFSSMTFLYTAAMEIREINKPTHIYYFGDWDPSGVLIPKKVEEDLRRHAPEADITFTRLGVNPEQIVELNLPTRPTKKTAPGANRFEGESVEVDAVPAPILRDMLEEAIVQHVDLRELRLLRTVEAEERKALSMFASEVA